MEDNGLVYVLPTDKDRPLKIVWPSEANEDCSEVTIEGKTYIFEFPDDPDEINDLLRAACREENTDDDEEPIQVGVSVDTFNKLLKHTGQELSDIAKFSVYQNKE